MVAVVVDILMQIVHHQVVLVVALVEQALTKALAEQRRQ